MEQNRLYKQLRNLVGAAVGVSLIVLACFIYFRLNGLAIHFRQIEIFVLEACLLEMATLLIILWISTRTIQNLLTPLQQIKRAIAEGDIDKLSNDWNQEEFNELGIALKNYHKSQQTELRDLGNHTKHLEAAIETSPIGFITIDQHGCIATFNHAAEGMFGYTRQEVIGQNVKMLMPSPYREEHDNYLKQYFATGKSELMIRGREVVGRRRNGKVFPIFLSVNQATLGDGSALFLANLRDLTHEKEIEQTLNAERARNIFSAKMASLGEMAGGIAHEINNPLTIILGYARQVRKLSLKGETNPDIILEKSDKIISTIDRIVRIIRGLRTFARDGSRDPRESVVIKDLVESSLALVEQRALRHHVDLRKSSFSEDLVICRPVQVSQVIINLISNAIDAIKYDDQKWIFVEQAVYDSHCVIRIINSGPPIPTDLHDKIFEPFFTTKPVGQRTGLGLSISKSIVENEQGTIYLDKSHSHTCFVFQLPLAKATDKAPLRTDDSDLAA